MSSASQPDLIREERGEYKFTPEQQAERNTYRARLCPRNARNPD